MTDLDLSFIDTKEDVKPRMNAEKETGLNLSFVGTKKDTPKPVERGFGQKVSDFFTGNDRETEQLNRFPELSQAGVANFEGGFGDASAALLSPNPEDIVSIITSNSPDVTAVFDKDAQGNVIPILHNRKNGATAVINQPGVTTMDVLQTLGLASAFTPAGNTLKVGGGILGNAAKVGGASAATQGGIDVAQQAAGREEDVSLGNVRAGDVALAGAAGAGFQALFQGLAKSIPALRQKIQDTGITDEVRTFVRESAVKLGLKADDITDDVITQIVKETDQAVSPEKAFALQGEKEFGIPLTSGQRSLDDAALSFEDSARVGLKGDKSQQVIRNFETQQQAPAVSAARDTVSDSLGGRSASTQEAGGLLREGVKAAEQQADDLVGEAFERVGKAELTSDGLKGLLRSTRRSLSDPEFDKTLPETKKLLDLAGETLTKVNRIQGKGGKIKDISLGRIEQMRRRINTAIGAADNPSDKRQVTIMKRAFDDFLDDAVQDSLFSGDDAALESLKKARGLFSEYAKKFRAQPIRGRSGRVVDRDEAGQFIEKIIDANPTDEQVVNAIFGASNFNKGSGAAMAKRFKEIIGNDSEGWTAVRQVAFKRLIKTNKVNGEDVISGQKTLKAIEDAVEKNGSLMKEVFSGEELGVIRRFAAQVKRTQPDIVKSRENPSGTAQVAGKALADTVKRIGTFFAATGEPLLAVTTNGVSVAKGFSNAGTAKNAIKPFEKIIINRGVAGSSTGLALSDPN